MSLMALLLGGCASKFHVAQAYESDRNTLVLTCSGAPQRFSVLEPGIVVPIGELELACLTQTGNKQSCQQREAGAWRVSEGTWLEARISDTMVSGTSAGAICFKPEGASSSCDTDDKNVLDFSIDCSRETTALIYMDGADNNRWKPVRGRLSIGISDSGTLPVIALRHVKLQVVPKADGADIDSLELAPGQMYEIKLHAGGRPRANQLLVRLCLDRPCGSDDGVMVHAAKPVRQEVQNAGGAPGTEQ